MFLFKIASFKASLQPEKPAIKAATSHDFNNFTTAQLSENRSVNQKNRMKNKITTITY